MSPRFSFSNSICALRARLPMIFCSVIVFCTYFIWFVIGLYCIFYDGSCCIIFILEPIEMCWHKPTTTQDNTHNRRLAKCKPNRTARARSTHDGLVFSQLHLQFVLFLFIIYPVLLSFFLHPFLDAGFDFFFLVYA